MLNKLINKVAQAICNWCERTGRVFYITGGPNGKTVYLVRYIPFKSKLACLYIHRFMRSDADYPHDHPWNFFTYVISGGYDEVFYNKKPEIQNGTFAALWTKTINRRLPGSIAYRKATDVHQVVVDRDYEMSEIEQAPFTVCLIGPRLREWGFWPLEGKGTTWIDWRKYLSITPNDPRTKGSE
jgi:hypothetical protein